MAGDTQNCSLKPTFKGLTQLFLDGFGTNKLPEGYVEGDEYGPRTKKQDFAELFTTFYILIVLALICVLAFLLMIILLVWYCNRDKYKPDQSRNPKLCTILLTSLLLLSLILLAIFIFSTFKNLLHLSKLYKQSKNNAKMESVNEILVEDLENLIHDTMFRCSTDLSLRDAYPETTKMRKFSITRRKMFDNFIKTSIEPIFDNTLLYDDLFRMFSRNFSAYLSGTADGKSHISNTNATFYTDAIFSLNEWGTLYQSAIAIKNLMDYFENSTQSDLRRSRVCYEINEYFNELASNARVQKAYLEGKLKLYYLGRDAVYAPPYKFGHVVCIAAIVILVVFFLFLMFSLVTRGNVMIQALLFIFIVLTLLLILMAFVTFYHFFYGVIEYNGFYRRTGKSAGNDNFDNAILTDCTEHQNVYTILLENNLIRPFSKWTNLNATKIQDICQSTCRPLNKEILRDLGPVVEKFPKKNQFCKFKPIKSTYLLHINLDHLQYVSPVIPVWMSDTTKGTYYSKRVDKSYCHLDFAKKASKFHPSFSKTKLLKCKTGFKVGRDFATSIPYTYDEVQNMCETSDRKCKNYCDQDVPEIIDDVNSYKANAERRLNNMLGSCATILPMVKTKENCEIFTLNGVWVGGLLFVIILFLALLLLASLIYKLVKRRDQCERCGDPAASILLPAITLPRHVIDTLEHDENPRVTYHVKGT